MKEVILSAKGLCKSFAYEGVQNHVLCGIDLDLYRGDFTVIMGSSGSGKSTLMYALSGMDRATAGQVIYGGEDIAAASEKRLSELRRRDFGFVFQQIHLVSNLTLFENITTAGYLSGKYTAEEVRARANALLDRMHIRNVGTHMPIQTSGGEQQRCAIARAVIHSPSLLFADEPTGALNRANSIGVLGLLDELHRNEQSILMVTHDRDAALHGNRLLYLDDGKLIGELELPSYTPEQAASRMTQISAWLSSLNW